MTDVRPVPATTTVVVYPAILAFVGAWMVAAVVAVGSVAVNLGVAHEDDVLAVFELVESELPVTHLGQTALDNLERIDRRLLRQRAGSPCGGRWSSAEVGDELGCLITKSQSTLFEFS